MVDKITTKPPVVFIHGLWSQPGVWANWESVLRDAGYPCFAIRLPGHRADADRAALKRLGKTRLHDYIETARAVVDSLPEPPIVIGHSLGGLIAQILAANVPLAAAVLVNTAAPGAVFPLRPKSLPGLVRHFIKPGLWARAFELSPAEASYLLFNAVPEAEREPLIAGLVPESGHVAYEIAFGRLNINRTNEVDKTTIECPMLAIAGQKDRIVPITVSRKTSEWYGDALTYWEYPDHAHWLLSEPGWEGIVDRTLKWLDQALAVR